MSYPLRILNRLTSIAQRLACRAGFGLTFYWWSARLWRRLSGSPVLQWLFLGPMREQVESFAREIGAAETDASLAVTDQLRVSILRPMFKRVLKNSSSADWEELFQVEGAEYLTASGSRRTGVILAHYHTLMKLFLDQWLLEQQIDPGITLWKWTKSISKENILSPETVAIGSASELLAAAELLEEGGIVQVLADGYKGKQKIVLPFCNRLRGFQPTFAELALLTGAAVVPVASILQWDGTVRLQIGPSFDPGADELGSDLRIQNLLAQYVAFLETQWHTYPGQVGSYHILSYLDLPRVE